MGELGTWLRETREAQGLSPEQVEAETRIRRTFVQALEEGHYHILPGEVYVRGFLRNYALFLGLDPTEVHHRYDEELISRGLQPRVQEGSGYTPVNAALETSVHPAVTFALRALLALLLLAAAGGIAIWYWYGFPLPQLPGWWPPRANMLFPDVGPRQTLPASEPPLLVVGPTSGPATTAPVPASPTVAPTSKAVATSAVLPLPIPTSLPAATPTPVPTPMPPPSQAQRIHLRVQVFERAWMQVTTDGQMDLEGILEAGEERTWEAEQSISLRCGNAGGVLVTVNDQELGTLGERGQVIDWTWVAQGDRIAVVTPSPS